MKVAATPVVVEKNGEVWVVRVPLADGRYQEFTCATERMARHLSATLVRSAVPR